MKNLCSLIAWIIWLMATVFLVCTFIGIIVLLCDEWWYVGRAFSQGVTR